MANKSDLKIWVVEALKDHGGKAHLFRYVSLFGTNMNQSLEDPETCSTHGNMICVGLVIDCGMQVYLSLNRKEIVGLGILNR